MKSRLELLLLKGYFMSYLCRFLFVFIVVCTHHISAANAQNTYELETLPPGQIMLNISAQEQIEIEQDMLVTTLNFEAITHSQDEAQDTVNKAIAKAIQNLKQNDDEIDFQTGHYSIYKFTPSRNAPQTNKKGEPLRWRAQQSIIVKTRNFSKATKIIGDMQSDGFLASGMNTVISPQTFADTKDMLMEDALKKLQKRATRAANALGKGETHFVEVNVQSPDRTHPQPMMMARGMMESVAVQSSVSTPSVHGGKSIVSLTVSARVILK